MVGLEIIIMVQMLANDQVMCLNWNRNKYELCEHYDYENLHFEFNNYYVTLVLYDINALM